MMGGVVELFARMIVAKISAHFMSYLGICLASPAAWVSAGIFFLVVYAVVIRKIQRRFRKMVHLIYKTQTRSSIHNRLQEELLASHW